MSDASHELRDFAYRQADRHRDGLLTREKALASIAARFPELTRRQVADAFARALRESR